MHTRMMVLAVAVLTLLGVSCKDGDTIAVSFSFPEKVKEYASTNSGVNLTLRLSRESPFEHTLSIENNSGSPVRLKSRDVELSIMGTAMVTPGIRDYDRFITATKRKTLLLCNEVDQSYSCVDEINLMVEEHLGKGFRFGKLTDGEKRSGYIIFNFPGPVARSGLTKKIRKNLREGRMYLDGSLRLHLKIGAIDHDVSFPVQLRILDDTDNMSIVLKSFWMNRR